MSDNANNQNEQLHDQVAQTAARAAASRAGYELVRLYAKNCSLETPELPEIFGTPWKPSVKVNFATHSKLLNQSKDDSPVKLASYEVVLRVTVTCTVGEKTAYICEVNQAGIFVLRNIVKQEEIEAILGAIAPNTLFPYARESISNLVNRATFPALNLTPVDFVNLYRARKIQEAQKQAAAPQAAEKKDEPVA